MRLVAKVLPLDINGFRHDSKKSIRDGKCSGWATVAARMSQRFGAVTRASVLCSCPVPPLLPSEWAVRARCDSSSGLPQLDFAGAGAHRWPRVAHQAPVNSGLSVRARALTHAEGGAQSRVT